MSTLRILTAAAVAVGGLSAIKVLSVADGAAALWLETPAYAAADTPEPAADEPVEDDYDADAGDPEPEDAAPTVEPVAAPQCPAPSIADRAGLSHNEIQVLKSLSDRRRELARQEDELSTRALLLETAETRVEDRVERLKELKAEIEALLGQLDEQEAVEVDRLVSMYEKMKPKEAAPILPLLDEDVRVQVAARMKEQNLAAILAAMPQVEAAGLTMLLARRHDRASDLDAAAAALAAE